jgi:transcriptional regulator with XRE-family HTH domain
MAVIELPEQVWERADVLAACRARDANALLRLARRHGVTNERLAHGTGIDPGEISKRLSGKTTSPVRTLDRWERIATGLGMSGSARLALGLAPRGPEPPPEGLLPELPRTLLDLLGQYARTDALLGPRSLLAPVGSQFALVERLWVAARGSLRAELVAVGARYAEFAGWLHQDAGHPGAATHWTRQALELAHAAGSPVLVPYVLMRLSHQAAAAGDAARTSALAEAALRPAPHPLLRALALRQVARGHALAGDAAGCERALDAARAAVVAGSEPGPELRSLAGYCTPAYVELEAADCWLRLGRPRRAIALLEATLPTWPAAQRRDRGVHLARLASAYTACDEPEKARAAAVEAAVLAEQTGSARIAAELARPSRPQPLGRTA